MFAEYDSLMFAELTGAADVMNKGEGGGYLIQSNKMFCLTPPAFVTNTFSSSGNSPPIWVFLGREKGNFHFSGLKPSLSSKFIHPPAQTFLAETAELLMTLL